MITAQVRVVSLGKAEDDAGGDDWGEWHFTSLPRTGDHIDLSRGEENELLTVHRIIHFAAQHPLPRSETPYRQRKSPTICIVATRRRGDEEVPGAR